MDTAFCSSLVAALKRRMEGRMELPSEIFGKVMLYLPLKDMVRLSTVNKASRALLYSQDFMRERATIMALEPEGWLTRRRSQSTNIPYLDAHGRFHDIRLDFLVPFNADHDNAKVEASNGGYILYFTTPNRGRRLKSDVPETNICICNPITCYRTVLPPLNFHFDFALMSVNGAAPNIRYRIALVSIVNDHDLKVKAYDSANAGRHEWRHFVASCYAPYTSNLRTIEQLSRANLESLLVYKPPGVKGRSSIWVLDLQAESMRVVRCPQGFQCSDVFIHQNNRIIALGMYSNLRRRGVLRFCFLELQLQGAPNLQWTHATLAQQSARLNDQLAREPAYSIQWEILRARSLNSLLFRKGDDFAIYNIDQESWHPFKNADCPLYLQNPDIYLDFHPP